jgi:uncharacterized protein (DUF362 family)
MKSPAKVHVVRTSEGGVQAGVTRLLAGLPLPPEAQQVALKLNLCDYRRPETGVTSDPEVVGALLAAFRQRYPRARLVLCENDSSAVLVDNVWGYLGLEAVAARHGAECLNLQHDEWRRVPVRGLCFDAIELPALLLDSDLVVNHPKLKTHGRTLMTCALKNLFGCYRPRIKKPFHSFLNQAIVDINLALKPALTVVDAHLCVEGNRGPTQGLPKKLGLLVAGDDPVAVDALCARLIGLRPWMVGHLRLAAQAGVGSLDYQLVGDKLEERDWSGFRWSWSKYFLMQALRRVTA